MADEGRRFAEQTAWSADEDGWWKADKRWDAAELISCENVLNMNKLYNTSW